MTDNHGVSAGHDISGGQLAVNVSGGQVNQSTTTGAVAPPDLQAGLERLKQLLDEHAQRLDEGAEAQGDLEDVCEQAADDKPDKRRMTDALKRLAERVSAVGALVAAVEDVAGKLGLTL